jgi:hypothetical protein
MKTVFYFLFFLTLNVFSQENQVDSLSVSDEKTYKVSMINLIANPEKYDGKKVFITGYIDIGYESYIFLNKDDYKNRNYSNGLAIATFLNTSPTELIKKRYNHNYIDLIGRFHTPAKNTELKSGAFGFIIVSDIYKIKSFYLYEW